MPRSMNVIAGAAGATLLYAAAPQAMADTTPSCTPQTCTWSISVGGSVVDSGSYGSSTTGGLSANPVKWANSNASVSLSLNGNTDPVLGTSFSAQTFANQQTFSISVSMPISLAGQISALSSMSYSLTTTNATGTTLGTTLPSGLLMTAFDSSSTNAVPPLSIGVDVGPGQVLTSGPTTFTLPTTTASSLYTLASGNSYDLMTVTLSFTLGPNSSFGMSGFVQQEPVPLPAAIWLLGTGVVGLFGLRRRRALA